MDRQIEVCDVTADTVLDVVVFVCILCSHFASRHPAWTRECVCVPAYVVYDRLDGLLLCSPHFYLLLSLPTFKFAVHTANDHVSQHTKQNTKLWATVAACI